MSRRWWWIGYTDPSRPRGQRAIGAVIVFHAGGFSDAEAWAAGRGLRPTGYRVEALGGSIHPSLGAPPPGWSNRFLDNQEAADLAKLWGGGLASPSDISAAFSDDAATEGMALFRKESQK